MTEFPNAEQLNELMIVGPITVRSACSHHSCPILGRLWVGVIPNEHSNLIGLSKYSRLAEWVMGRAGSRRRRSRRLADLLMHKVQPGWPRGGHGGRSLLHALARRQGYNTKMVNSVMRGSFLKNSALRREFLSLINLTNSSLVMLVRLLYASRASCR